MLDVFSKSLCIVLESFNCTFSKYCVSAFEEIDKSMCMCLVCQKKMNCAISGQNSKVKYASFKTIIVLYRSENDFLNFDIHRHLKGYLKRQNVNLALKMFNPFIIHSLLQFMLNDRTKIQLKNVNLNTFYNGKRLNNIYQELITAYKKLGDFKIVILKFHIISHDLFFIENGFFDDLHLKYILFGKFQTNALTSICYEQAISWWTVHFYQTIM